MVDISALLAESRRHHLQKKHSAGRASPTGAVTVPPNYQSAEQSIASALLARLAAETHDPAHEHPAWYDDRVEARTDSPSLIRWYASYLATDRYSDAWDTLQAALTPEQRQRLTDILLTQVEL